VARSSIRDLVVRLPIDPDVEVRGIGPELPFLARAGLVACGGGAGAAVRAAIEGNAPPSNGFPWLTLLVNVTGAGLLALLVVLLEELLPTNRALRPLLGAGLLGGYTTFSTFAVETVVLLRAGAGGDAFAYVVCSVLGAASAAVLGIAAGRAGPRLGNRPRWHRRRHRARVQTVDRPA
jgi:fluoride exporter